MRRTTFVWRGRELAYLDHPYNTTILNERAVEVPIAEAWHLEHEAMDPDYLEAGNVLQHYGWGGHVVVDLGEVADGVTNEDILEHRGRYDRIVAISFLEHVGGLPGRTPPDPAAAVAAFAHLYDMLKPGGEMLVTVPFGQNPYLDVAILDGRFAPSGKYGAPSSKHQESTMVRHWKTGDWDEVEGRHWLPAREEGWAQAVWVGTWSN